MNYKKKMRAIRVEIRKSRCPDCAANPLTFCVNKSSGEGIRGVHKSRQFAAFLEGHIIQNLDGQGLESWDLP